MYETCRQIELLCLESRQTLPNGVESIDMVSSKSNFPDSNLATKLQIDIAVSLDDLTFVRTGLHDYAENFAEIEI